jgi:NAD(P)-dependent dehydrogenase (short-subunit alcohol dehydrogenase family)
MEESKVVVVTGITGGLGPAVAEAFAAAGYNVAGVARKAGVGPYEPFAADLTSAEAVAQLAADVLRRFGRVDVLAHVAGGYAGGNPITEIDSGTWQQMLNLNVTTAFHLIREFLPQVKKSSAGRIVAVGSRAGLEISRNMAAYTASKAALHALIQATASELKGTSTTANAVLPSTIDTAANRSWGTAEQAAKWVSPQSIAAVMVWLASEAATDINGALVPVYGGA